MSSTSQRPVSKRSAATVFYFLALGAGIMRTVSVGFDVVALNLTPIDPIIFGIMSQWVSYIATFGVVFLLSVKYTSHERRRALGYSLDPDFGGISLLPKKPMIYVILAGVFAGISTASYYILLGTSDASVVLPYGQLVVIYLLVGDLFAEKDTPTIIEIHSIVSILFGVLLVGTAPGGFDLPTLFLVLGPMNLSSAMMTYYSRKAKRYEIRPGLRVDTLNMRLWSLLVLNCVFSVLALPFLPGESLAIMNSTFGPLLGLMIGSSLTAFLSITMYVRALGRGSMAIVNSLSSISVVLGIPMILLGNLILPGAFGTITSDMFLWSLKLFGIVLVMVGVIALEASDIRSIMLVNVKPKAGDLLPELFAVKGVESVSALAGPHDYLLSVKSRSLAKTKKLILERIEMIEGVSSVRTLVVLRDYR